MSTDKPRFVSYLSTTGSSELPPIIDVIYLCNIYSESIKKKIINSLFNRSIFYVLNEYLSYSYLILTNFSLNEFPIALFYVLLFAYPNRFFRCVSIIEPNTLYFIFMHRQGIRWHGSRVIILHTPRSIVIATYCHR